jgi:hypothetical protein
MARAQPNRLGGIMNRCLAVLLCLLIAVPAWADEQKKKTHKLFDRKMILAGLTMLAAEVADNESTMALLHRNHGAAEANPFYGRHPSRLRIYSIGTALTGLMFASSLATRYESIRHGRPDSKLWLTHVVIHDAAHGFAAWYNTNLPSSHPLAIHVRPAAGAACP